VGALLTTVLVALTAVGAALVEPLVGAGILGLTALATVGAGILGLTALETVLVGAVAGATWLLGVPVLTALATVFVEGAGLTATGGAAGATAGAAGVPRLCASATAQPSHSTSDARESKTRPTRRNSRTEGAGKGCTSRASFSLLCYAESHGRDQPAIDDNAALLD